jgi:hypothetical protein
MRNPNLILYRCFLSKEDAENLLLVFPYFEEFLDTYIQRNYPISKCTKEMVACLPKFTPKEEKFLDACYRNFEETPIKDWYASKKVEVD